MKKYDKIGIMGAGGFGRETADSLLLGRYARAFEYAELCFVEPFRTESCINGIPVLTEDEFATLAGRIGFVAAIADYRTRRTIVQKMVNFGFEELGLRAQTARIDPSVQLGPGALICDFACITANADVGRSFHANVFSYVAHDCLVGDYVTLGPYASCLGRVVIEADVFIGAKAVIRNGDSRRPTVIGRGAKIGMGAVVLKNVEPGEVIVGNPGRPLRKG